MECGGLPPLLRSPGKAETVIPSGLIQFFIRADFWRAGS
jgi:hypothetical protein